MEQPRPISLRDILGAVSDIVIVDASLVSYLRRGLRVEVGVAAERITTMMLVMEAEPAPEAVDRAHEILEAAYALRRRIAPREDQTQESLELNLSSDAQLVFRALAREHAAELDRLQERAAYGLDSGVRGKEIQALGELVMEVKRIILRQGGRRPEVFPVEPYTETRPHSQRKRSARGSRGPRPRR
jgi:hypothetical protein